MAKNVDDMPNSRILRNTMILKVLHSANKTVNRRTTVRAGTLTKLWERLPPRWD